ncbi:PCMD domain-containing protein [uncultured Muribaculum sp.]|uniref:PCMD domain-containing protein n=1 Tax=uncultured Muribaculum sp. TaxID=1918613 RepID=UPI0025B20E1B|nr:PCMD domain-containing protein [uncultured Muribaculum sp.]
MILGFNELKAETIEKIPFGDMESWIIRNITESKVLGGEKKTIYAIGSTRIIEGATTYTPDKGNPWATSNVLANVCGVVKTSNAVSPGVRDTGGKCAVMTTKMENCKVIGLVNIDVLVSGSIFLGRMFEPIKSTSNPYSKMEMGIPFTKRPKFLQFDYKLFNPGTGLITNATGRKTRTYQGKDKAEVFVILQQRWEDDKGNIYAKRVGTGRERFEKSTNVWVNKHRIEIRYGNISILSDCEPYMGLISKDKSYYARNSKGKMVPVHENDWDTENNNPTHILIMASSGCGTAYTGTVGMEFSIDNISLIY